MIQEATRQVTIVRVLDKRPDWQRVLKNCIVMNGPRWLAGTYHWEEPGPYGHHYTAIDLRDVRSREAFIFNAESLGGCVIEYVNRVTLRKYIAEGSKNAVIQPPQLASSQWQLTHSAEHSVYFEELEPCYSRLSAGCKDLATYEGSKLVFTIYYLQMVLLTEQNPELGTVEDCLRKIKESRS